MPHFQHNKAMFDLDEVLEPQVGCHVSGATVRWTRAVHVRGHQKWDGSGSRDG